MPLALGLAPPVSTLNTTGEDIAGKRVPSIIRWETSAEWVILERGC